MILGNAESWPKVLTDMNIESGSHTVRTMLALVPLTCPKEPQFYFSRLLAVMAMAEEHRVVWSRPRNPFGRGDVTLILSKKFLMSVKCGDTGPSPP